jgi:hypothetical protein
LCRYIAVCEAALEDHKEDCPPCAALSLGRMNTWKRLASGWQRATKCLKERAALSNAVEEVPTPLMTTTTRRRRSRPSGNPSRPPR